MTDLESAVMAILWKDPAHNETFKSIGECKKEIERIGRLLLWANTLSKEQGKKYYVKWLYYFIQKHNERIDRLEADKRTSKIIPTLPKLPM